VSDANLAVQIALGDDEADRLITLIGDDAERLDNDNTARFAVHTGIDTIEKYLFVINLKHMP
jgi:hypothetical protein